MGANPGPREADYLYVGARALGSVREKLKTGGLVTQAEADGLLFPEELPDEELVVPVDMQGAGCDFVDLEQMAAELGPQGAAAAFVAAADHFDATKDSVPEGQRPQPMKAADWKIMLEGWDASELLAPIPAGMDAASRAASPRLSPRPLPPMGDQPGPWRNGFVFGPGSAEASRLSRGARPQQQ